MKNPSILDYIGTAIIGFAFAWMAAQFI